MLETGKIFNGNCIDEMSKMPENSIDYLLLLHHTMLVLAMTPTMIECLWIHIGNLLKIG